MIGTWVIIICITIVLSTNLKIKSSVGYVDLVILNDLRENNNIDKSAISNALYALINALTKLDVDIRVGFAGFSNKPAPGLGYGNGLGVLESFDTCYKMIKPLEYKLVDKALFKEFFSHEDLGPVRNNSLLDALLRLRYDKTMRFRDFPSTNNNQPFATIALTFTDSYPNRNGDLLNAIDAWNDKNDTSPEGVFTPSIAKRKIGLGADDSWGKQLFFNDRDSVNFKLYKEYVDEKYRYIQSNFSRYNSKLVSEAEALFGPKFFPDDIKQLDDIVSTNPEISCTAYEYPTSYFIRTHVSEKIIPLIVISSPSMVPMDAALRCKYQLFNPPDDETLYIPDSFRDLCLLPFYKNLIADISDRFDPSSYNLIVARDQSDSKMFYKSLLNAHERVLADSCRTTPHCSFSGFLKTPTFEEMKPSFDDKPDDDPSPSPDDDKEPIVITVKRAETTLIAAIIGGIILLIIIVALVRYLFMIRKKRRLKNNRCFEPTATTVIKFTPNKKKQNSIPKELYY